jgi:hypothetical protein
MGQNSPYNRFWGQLVRWLANTDIRNRQRGAGVDALLNKNIFQLGERPQFRAMVRDEKGDATRYAQVTLEWRSATDDAAQRLPLAPSSSHTGLFSVTLPAPPKGDYQATLIATKDGRELGRQALKFTVIAPADEMLKLAADPQMLQTIATRTHGFYYECPELGTLISQLVRTTAGDTGLKQQSVPLASFIRVAVTTTAGDPGWAKTYDLPMQGALAILLLGTEWLLRRKWQLP